MKQLLKKMTVFVFFATTLMSGMAQVPQKKLPAKKEPSKQQPKQVITKPILTQPVVFQSGLQGWVDMHTHPAAQWGFGEQLFYGENEGDPASALGSCGCYHNFVAWPFDGNCGQQNM